MTNNNQGKEEPEYDVIVIGGGPNGEVLACYLQRAGGKVLLVERRHEMGGGLMTEDFAGFRFNLHATYMMMGELMPPVNDLFLAQYGVDFPRPEVQMSLFYEKNRALVFYLDPRKTADSIRRLSPGDEAKFEKLYGDFKNVCEKCLIPWTYVPPQTPENYSSMLRRTEIGRKVLELTGMSAIEIIESYGIRDDRVKAAILYLGCKWGVDPNLKGIGHLFAFYAYRMMNAAIVRGGSHRLNSAIMRSGYEAGLEVKELTEAKKIIVENGEAKGIVTTKGEEIRARAVVSSLNPPKTFLELVGEDKLRDPEIVDSAKNWQWDQWSLFCMHMATKTLPKYKAESTDPHCGEAISCVIGYSGVDEVVKHWKDSMNSTLPGTNATFTPMSLFDPSQAPTGYNIVRVETEAPYEVAGSDWDTLMYEYRDSILDDWYEYLTNKEELRIIKNYVYPPNYIELKLPDMVRGSFKQGAYIPSQIGYLRPNSKCSSYSTPIKGLYVTGAFVHPGGMITLGPGYAAARKVADDLGLEVWWKAPDWLEEARKNGFVAFDRELES
ncbi:MAG: phytoene desaturase family protein [Nitrososphaerales archaeon]